ncbi:histone [Candidatus Magnetomorum sp. HK-1]|nr:histone [Candidatus Magnetomorum sp. HK-1]
MTKLRGIKDLVQAAIDKGATSVEEVHMSIANMPLNVLEKVSLLESPAKEIKKIHEKSVGSVYNLIRKINNEAGEIAETLINKAEKIENETENY